MKLLVLAFLCLGTSFLSHAATRCAQVVKDSVRQQARFDFPGRNLTVSLPDFKNADDVQAETYVVDVVESSDFSRLAARYRITVNTACSVVRGPNLIQM